jgi:hypothetical protein
MRTPQHALIVATVLFASIASTAQAQHSDAETRLRDMLRQTTIELRDVQSQNAQLRSQVDELTAQREAATAAAPAASPAQSEELRRARNDAEQLRASVTELQRALDQRDQTLAQWKQAYEQAEQLARTRDADAKQLDEQQRSLNARVEVCERDNAELVGIAHEILDRYRHKGVWDAMRDAEPLTGIHRVRLEALAQEYHTKIVDRDVSLTPAMPASSSASDAMPQP